MARTVQCVYLKREAEGLDFSVYPGELGKRIYENVSKEAFEAWKKHQTMLVNENRLNLADARARQYLARQMESFFFGGGAEQPAGYVPPARLNETFLILGLRSSSRACNIQGGLGVYSRLKSPDTCKVSRVASPLSFFLRIPR